MKSLIGFLGRELPDLRMLCFQVQWENVNEMYFSFGKICKSVYINRSEKWKAVLSDSKDQEVFVFVLFFSLRREQSILLPKVQVKEASSQMTSDKTGHTEAYCHITKVYTWNLGSLRQGSIFFSVSINNPSLIKIHTMQKYEWKEFPINDRPESNKQDCIVFWILL